MIGENLDGIEEVVGCRVVDKKHDVKLEVWLKCTEDNPKVEQLR